MPKDIKLIGVEIIANVISYKNSASIEIIDGKVTAISMDGKIFRPEKNLKKKCKKKH